MEGELMNYFAKAVSDTVEISKCLKNGLKALGGNSSKVVVGEPRKLEGSVNIDDCLSKRYPSAARWDYVFGYKNKIYYVEVHKGKLSEVKKIVEKVKWLKDWRKRCAKNLDALGTSGPYYWVATGRIDQILPGSRYERMLANNQIEKPKSELNFR